MCYFRGSIQGRGPESWAEGKDSVLIPQTSDTRILTPDLSTSWEGLQVAHRKLLSQYLIPSRQKSLDAIFYQYHSWASQCLQKITSRRNGHHDRIKLASFPVFSLSIRGQKPGITTETSLSFMPCVLSSHLWICVLCPNLCFHAHVWSDSLSNFPVDHPASGQSLAGLHRNSPRVHLSRTSPLWQSEFPLESMSQSPPPRFKPKLQTWDCICSFM